MSLIGWLTILKAGNSKIPISNSKKLLNTAYMYSLFCPNISLEHCFYSSLYSYTHTVFISFIAKSTRFLAKSKIKSGLNALPHAYYKRSLAATLRQCWQLCSGKKERAIEKEWERGQQLEAASVHAYESIEAAAYELKVFSLCTQCLLKHRHTHTYIDKYKHTRIHPLAMPFGQNS